MFLYPYRIIITKNNADSRVNDLERTPHQIRIILSRTALEWIF